MVPCAEMVRFGKNGSDATVGRGAPGARLDRARPRRGLRLPRLAGLVHRLHRAQPRRAQGDAGLTHAFAYNDLDCAASDASAARPGEFAAVILEPMNVAEPKPGYLEGVRRWRTSTARCWCSTRPSPASATPTAARRSCFGVTPDLATFGKGLANGYPVSAVAGRRDVMKLMEEIFFSFTFGGETLSLAAAKATLTKLKTRAGGRDADRRAARPIIDGARRIVADATLGRRVLAQRATRPGVPEHPRRAAALPPSRSRRCGCRNCCSAASSPSAPTT